MATKEQIREKEATIKALSEDAAQNHTSLPYSHIVVMIDRLHRHETTLSRIYTTMCNRELTQQEITKKNNTEDAVKNIARALCIPVYFNQDPRGGAIRFILSSGRSNNMGGEDWGIYW